MRLTRVKTVHVGIICCFLRLNVVLDATYFSVNEKKIVGAGDIDLKIRRVLQNMQSEHFNRRKEQRIEVIEAQHDSTDDAMDTTLAQYTLDVLLGIPCFK